MACPSRPSGTSSSRGRRVFVRFESEQRFARVGDRLIVGILAAWVGRDLRDRS